MKIRDRIVELRRVKASDLRPNPRNWRRHPDDQRAALEGILQDVGYADALLARVTEDGGLMLIDGHLRAETTPDQKVPVLVTDLTEAEGDELLATLDPLGAMAQSDKKALDALLGSAESANASVTLLLDALAQNRLQSLDITPVDGTEWPGLSDGDQPALGQTTFTVTQAQRVGIEAALTKARPGATDPVNANSNGNALAAICARYVSNG